MSLYYPASEKGSPGKMSEKEDRFNVCFEELTPPEKIVQSITFISNDSVFSGEMIMEVLFEKNSVGTKVTITFKNIPPGIRPEDNEAGMESSLE